MDYGTSELAIRCRPPSVGRNEAAIATDEEHSLTGYDPARYGEAVGDEYDELYPGVLSENEAAVEILARLAAAHPARAVLEFGIGTGRLALPLSRLGFHVAGIEGSDRMIKSLREKPDGESIQVVKGDYRDAVVGGHFSVVVLTLNGIFDPRGLHAQLEIFRNAQRHLVPAGYFVVESMVLTDVQRGGSWAVAPRYVGTEHVELQLFRFDIGTNRIHRTLVHLRPQGLNFVEVVDTYASPGELDVIAYVTNFDRKERFATWSATEFTAASTGQVSVYQLRD